jgi:LacI family transcriptional regulator
MTKNIDASEIARLAKVTRATVSRVINNYAFVKRSTRERVLEVIEKHAYSPNFSAQILAGKRSNTIGLFHLSGDRPGARSRLEDTHVNFMVERIINTATIAGYYVLVYQVYDAGNIEVRKKIRDMFFQNRVDAGIFINFPNDSDVVEELIGRGFVVGAFNQHLDHREEPNRVLVRLDYSGIVEEVAYAAQLGHQDIMFVSTDMVRQYGVDISGIFRAGMRAKGLPVQEKYILHSQGLTKPYAMEVFTAFMESREVRPTGIICANDSVALGVMEVLQSHNFRIPGDISIMGSDDILVSQFFSPPLTTMRFDFDNMMKTLTTKVVECVEHPFSEQFLKTFTGGMVIRGSCKPMR